MSISGPVRIQRDYDHDHGYSWHWPGKRENPRTERGGGDAGCRAPDPPSRLHPGAHAGRGKWHRPGLLSATPERNSELPVPVQSTDVHIKASAVSVSLGARTAHAAATSHEPLS